MRPILPGEHLREEMTELALVRPHGRWHVQGVPANRAMGILNDTRAITADTALRLACYFGTTPEFWLNMQQSYDLRRTRRAFGKRIE